jgi:hypothetical protein
MKQADMMPDGRPGQIGLSMSTRILSYMDLDSPSYQEFYKVTEEARAFGESIQPPPEPALVDQVMKLAQDKFTARQLPDVFKKYGMDPARADKLADEMLTKGEAIGGDIILMMVAHQKDVFAPIQELADKK